MNKNNKLEILKARYAKSKPSLEQVAAALIMAATSHARAVKGKRARLAMRGLTLVRNDRKAGGAA